MPGIGSSVVSPYQPSRRETARSWPAERGNKVGEESMPDPPAETPTADQAENVISPHHRHRQPLRANQPQPSGVLLLLVADAQSTSLDAVPKE